MSRGTPKPRATKKADPSKALRVRYLECKVVAFSVTDTDEPVPQDLKYHLEHEAIFDDEENVIQVLYDAALYTGELEVRTTFMTAKVRHRFHVGGVEHVEVEDGQPKFPVTFIRSVLGLAFSATRGILVERLAGTSFAGEIVPIYRASRLYSVNEEVDKGGSYPV